ncbi:MAG: hypothetical protein P4M08_05550, partial [Oligoflexia bacterium]|nr:hypothetical protein [Oligoflexia bacterium]
MSAPAHADNGRLLDTSLKPDNDTSAETPTIFKDMGVVQNKAIQKTGKLLLSIFGSEDFTDGPYSFYRANFDIGYAPTEFWEIYFGVAPIFNVERSVTSQIEGYSVTGGTCTNFKGCKLSFQEDKGKTQYSLAAYWSPLYGKDSLGLQHIVHSDTFLKFGGSYTQYESNSGVGFFIGVGKT